MDGFYTQEDAVRLSHVVLPLQYAESEFGKEIQNFNFTPADANEVFSRVLGTKVEMDEEKSGVFRLPKLFIHFEPFDNVKEWLFVVAVQSSTFNLFEHQSGAKNALEGYKFNYRNLFEWDLTVNYLLQPGQGIFFRPWLFHSFDTGLVQVFRLREVE